MNSVYGIVIFDEGKLINVETFKKIEDRNKRLREIYFDKELNEHFIDLFASEIK